MSNAETKISYDEANKLVEQTLQMVGYTHTPWNQPPEAPFNTIAKYDVAGSVRRHRPDVSDIELVCIPRFYNGINLLWWQLDRLAAAGQIKKAVKVQQTGKNIGRESHRWGDKYRAFTMPHSPTHIEIFLASGLNYGIQLAIRTGPHEFNVMFLQKLKNQGYVNDEGHLWAPNPNNPDFPNLIPITDEDTYFQCAGFNGVIPPEKRWVDQREEPGGFFRR